MFVHNDFMWDELYDEGEKRFDGPLTLYLRQCLPPVDFHSSDQDILPDIKDACSQHQSPTKPPHHCKFEITVHATVKQGKT